MCAALSSSLSDTDERCVQVIDAGAVRPLVAMLGVEVAEALAFFLLLSSNQDRRRGEWVGDTALLLGNLVQEARRLGHGDDVGDMAVLALRGVSSLLTNGTSKGRAEAAAAVWGLALGGPVVKLACIQSGFINQLIDLLAIPGQVRRPHRRLLVMVVQPQRLRHTAQQRNPCIFAIGL